MDAPSFLEPLIESFPPPVQDFLNSGGWLLFVAAAGLVILLVIRAAFRAVRARMRRKRTVPEISLTEDLSTYPPPPAQWGERRLTIHGLPVRQRLIVAAPLGYEAGQVSPEEIETLLDRLVPGMGQMARADKPRVRIWPVQLSHQGFIASFLRHTITPDPEKEPSRWVLITGRALIERRPIGLGLVLLAEQENLLGRIMLEHPHQWMEALKVRP